MFSRVATTLVILALVGGSAFADAKMGGVAREIAMGGSGIGGVAFNPYIWNDPTVQYFNPAYQGMYKDYGWTNFGGGSVAGLTTGNNGYGLQHGGVNFSFGDKLAIGTILSYDPSGLNSLISGMPLVNPAGGYLSGFTGVSPAEVLEFVGSYGLDHIHLGLALMYGWTGQDFSDSTGKRELSGTVVGFRGGVTWDFGSGSAVEGSLAYRSSSVDDKSVMLSADGSLTELVFAARGRFRMNNKVNLIPVIAFGSGSGTVNYPNGANANATGDLTVTALAIGAGAEITYSSLYLAGGLSYAMAENEVTLTVPPGTGNKTTTTGSGVPVLNLGGEWWFTDWLAGRAGYFRAFTNVKTETNFGGVSTEANFFSGTSIVSVGGYTNDDLVVFGLAARFGNFGLETTVSEEALRRGFGVIGGGSDNINTFGYFTANWNFE